MNASRLPPGQALTEKWPVLHYGGIPRVDPAAWTFTVEGDVETPCRWTWDEFAALPRKSVRCDIHCVTAWSRYDNVFEGVPASEVIGRARPRADAAFVMAHSHGGYTTNVRLDDLMQDDVVFAFTHDGRPLSPNHGAPCRLGYHIRGDPWKEERYSDPW